MKAIHITIIAPDEYGKTGLLEVFSGLTQLATHLLSGVDLDLASEHGIIVSTDGSVTSVTCNEDDGAKFQMSYDSDYQPKKVQ